MVLNFSLGNFRSFNEIQTIDFRATGLASESAEVDENNVVDVADNKVLKIAGVYGANGSGKTNLIRGLFFFKRMVEASLDSQGLLEALYNPFRLSVNSDYNKTYFQTSMLIDKKKYRYGFTIKDKNTIAEEWLYGPAEKNETFYFKRKEQEIESNKDRFFEITTLPLQTLRTDTLFLTFSSAYNVELSKKIRTLFAERIIIENISNSRRGFFEFSPFENQNTNKLVELGKKSLVLEWLSRAGLFYNDININEVRVGSPNYSYFLISFVKEVLGNNGEVSGIKQLLLEEDESSGTQKFYSYIGILNNLFSEGGIFIVDEIDSNFHPALLLKLVSFFNNPALNKANAQLLFTSHDTNLLDPKILRRDQIWFTEKSQRDATILYSLADLKGIRNNADFAKQYLAGFYGALPVLGNYLTEESLTQITAE